MEYPDLLSEDKIPITRQLFPSDAIERAQLLKKHIKSVGAYSVSQGIQHIRENVAKFISGTRILILGRTNSRPRWISCICGSNFPYCRCFTGSQLSTANHPCDAERWHSDPDSSISIIHCLTVSSQRPCDPILSK